jgi:hypothetical protein
MMRWLVHWMMRVVVILAVAFVVLYTGDWSVYKLRGSPQGKVSVSRYVTIPLKGNRQEYDYLGTFDAPCSRSLFSQVGLATCWQLSRSPNQGFSVD